MGLITVLIDLRWAYSYFEISFKHGCVCGKYSVFYWPSGKITSTDFINGLYGISADLTLSIQQTSDRSVNKHPDPFFSLILFLTHLIF
jgi:hypothetical protein